MSIFTLWSSNDNGFRFPVGKPSSSYDNIMDQAQQHIDERRKHQTVLIPQFTQEQLENTSPPSCHGEVIGLFCLDGPNHENEEDAYKYDWLYVVEIESCVQ